MDMDIDKLPGFRFYPTEEDLLSYFLHNKLNNLRAASMALAVTEVDVFSHEPRDLIPQAGQLCMEDETQWLFFRRHPETEPGAVNFRVTVFGFWFRNTFGLTIYSSTNRHIGIKNTWEYFLGRPQLGRQKSTPWVINEYLLYEQQAIADTARTVATADITILDQTWKVRTEFSLCQLVFRSDMLTPSSHIPATNWSTFSRAPATNRTTFSSAPATNRTTFSRTPATNRTTFSSAPATNRKTFSRAPATNRKSKLI